MRFDLLIKGGEVVDSPAGLRGRLDVGVTRGAIAAVEPDLPVDGAARVIDATGRLVTPGLIDLHAHCFPKLTFWGVDPDAVGSRTGVTTWVDAGSAGAYTIGGMRELIAERATVRILAFLNISSIGLVGHNYELENLAFSDPVLFGQMAREHGDIVVGAKARMGFPTVGTNGTESLERAVRAADELGLPTMVHIATGPPAIADVVAELGDGDILTHFLTAQDMKIVDGEGRMLDAVGAARDRGLIFDLGHGSGSFSYATAEPLLAAGVRPDVISTDIHQLSIDGPMFDLPTCMSKFLGLGLSLDEVVELATAAPARIIGFERRLGTLAPGAAADVALFELKRGKFSFYDIDWNERESDELLVNTTTIVGGRPMERRPLPEPAPWMSHDFADEQNFYINTELKEELLRRGHTPAQMAASAGGSEPGAV